MNKKRKTRVIEKKLTAILCAIIICVTAISWPVNRAGAAATAVKKITIQLEEGYTLVDEDGYDVTEVPDEKMPATNYSYTYQQSTKTLVVEYPDEAEAWSSSSLTFYVKAEAMPKIDSLTGYKRNTLSIQSVSNTGYEADPNYKISINLSLGTGDISFNLKAGVVKYDVEYPFDGDDYTITDDRGESLSGKTVSCPAGEITFKVAITPGKNVVPVVMINNKTVSEESSDGDEYTYKYNVTGPTTITVSSREKTYSLTFQEPAEKNYIIIPGSNMWSQSSIPHGGNYSFYVLPNENAEPPVVTLVTSDKGTLNNLGSNQYMLSNVTGDVTISIVAGATKQVRILHTQTAGASFYKNEESEGSYKTPLDASVPVDYGTSHSFVVGPDAGYEITAVYANNEPFTVEDGNLKLVKKDDYWICTINKVTEAMNITVTTVRKKYTVEIESGDSGDGYEILSDLNTTVEAGTRYEFHVKSKTGYGAPSVQYTVDDKDQKTLSPVNEGTYIIPSVNGNIKITVTSGEKNTYGVTFIPQTGVTYKTQNGDETITGVKSVSHGDSISFKIDLDSPYSNSKVQVLVDGVEIQDKDGVYTVDNVTSNRQITVNGVSINTYEVTLPHDTGYSCTTTGTTNSIAHGTTFRFRVVADTGYRITKVEKIVSQQSENLRAESSGTDYSFVVTGDTTIKVTVEKIPVEITIEDETNDHADVVNVSEGPVNYGDTYQFNIKTDLGYRVKQVDVNDTPISANARGIYTIQSVTSMKLNIHVTVELINITLNYSSNKYAGKLNAIDLKKINIESVESGKIELPNPNKDSKVWAFEGWTCSSIDNGEKLEEITKAQVEELLKGQTEDIAIDLSANWVKAFDKLVSSIPTEGNWSQKDMSDGRHTVSFKTSVKFDEAIEQVVDSIDEDDQVTIDAVGVIYSSNPFKTHDYEQDIVKAYGQNANPYIIDESTYIYYVKLGTSLKTAGIENLNDLNILLTKKSVNPGKRYSAGWIRLSAGTEYVLIYCDTPAALTNGAGSSDSNDGSVYNGPF